MKKILLAALLLLGGFSVAHAQSLFQFGIKGGLLINSSDLKYTFSGTQNPYDESSTKPGFELGVQFHGTPEVYTDNGDLGNLMEEADNEYTDIINKLTVYPVLKLRLSGRIF